MGAEELKCAIEPGDVVSFFTGTCEYVVTGVEKRDKEPWFAVQLEGYDRLDYAPSAFRIVRKAKPRPSADCARCFHDPIAGTDRVRHVCTGRNGGCPTGSESETALDTLKRLAAGSMTTVLPPKHTQDNVNLPHHYARFAIEPVHFCVENRLNFLQSNVVKYTLRHDAKNGKEDLKKGIRNLVMLIKKEYGNDPRWSGPDEALAEYLKTL